jgi:hypothetical protein
MMHGGNLKLIEYIGYWSYASDVLNPIHAQTAVVTSPTKREFQTEPIKLTFILHRLLARLIQDYISVI